MFSLFLFAYIFRTQNVNKSYFTYPLKFLYTGYFLAVPWGKPPKQSSLQIFKIFKTIQRLVEGLVLLGKVEAHQVVHRFPKEAGTRHRGNAHLLRHVNAELFVGQLATIKKNV